MALDNGTLPSSEVTLTDLAKQLKNALENPAALRFGEFAEIVERLHGELSMMKAHGVASTADDNAQPFAWLAHEASDRSGSEISAAEIEMLAEILAAP
ncbi:MAG: hypothetical protein WC807_19680 [Hyphomicrobium sp.]|jgi:hypothetical protein